MLRSLLVIIILSIITINGIVLVNSTPNAILPEIGYQIHSYDDLREWPQVLLKGANYLKIDAHFLDPQFCAAQQRVVDPSLGCFVLTHDLPMVITGRAPYNTTDDILLLIASNDYRKYFTAPAPRVAIALCFKYDFGNPCDGSARAANWTKLVDRFFTQANNIITKYQLTVDFVMDGSGTPNQGRQCLKDLWRPWVSTWIVGQDPMDAATSNDAAKGYDRFQINNMAEGIPSAEKIEIMKKIAYGKFANLSWPYQLWEPSDQQRILDILAAYSTGPRHAAGFRFSINIDPVQFHIYAGPSTGLAWNAPLPLAASLPKGSTPFVTVSRIPFGPPIEGKVTVAIVIVYDPSKNQHIYQPYSIDSVVGTWKPIQSASSFPLPSNWQPLIVQATSTATSTDNTRLLLASNMNAGYSIYDITYGDRIAPLKILSSGRLPGVDTSIVWSTMAISSDGTGAAGFALVHVFGSSSCSINVQLFSVSTQGDNITQRGDTVCILRSRASIVDASVDMVRCNSAQCTCGAQPDALNVLLTYSARASSVPSTSIFAIHMCMRMSSGYSSSIGPVQLIGAGSRPRVSLLVDVNTGSDIQFAIAAADSFCWNNIGDNTKATPALCDVIPTSLPSVMTYTIGYTSIFSFVGLSDIQYGTPIDDSTHRLLSKLVDYHISHNVSVTACSQSGIIHGMYDMGNAPTIRLFTDESNTVGVIEVHQGIDDSVKDDHRCGRALSRGSTIVMDSWIPHY